MVLANPTHTGCWHQRTPALKPAQLVALTWLFPQTRDTGCRHQQLPAACQQWNQHNWLALCLNRACAQKRSCSPLDCISLGLARTIYIYTLCVYCVLTLRILCTYVAYTVYLHCIYCVLRLRILCTYVSYTVYLRCVYCTYVAYTVLLAGKSPYIHSYTVYVGLARTIYIRCVYCTFGREITIRLVELYSTVRWRSVRYAPYLLDYGVLP